jgi:hypothetical protein
MSLNQEEGLRREEELQMRAYAIWERHGRPDGTQDEDWRLAILEMEESAGPISGRSPARLLHEAPKLIPALPKE